VGFYASSLEIFRCERTSLRRRSAPNGAAPITDDRFHHDVLSYKIARARNRPEIHRLLEDLATSNQIKTNFLTTGVFRGEKLQVELPSLSREVPVERLLKYRQKHGAELDAARRELGWLAQEIAQGPWTEAFEETIDREYLPKRVRPSAPYRM
jgi:hypothetical protein